MLQYEDTRTSPINSCGDALSHSPSPSLSSTSCSSSNSPTPNKFVYSTPNVYGPQTNLNQAQGYYYNNNTDSPSQQAYYNAHNYNQQQNYYNQYYNYNKNNVQSYNNNSSYYNDSNYYSRNSSINTSDLNDSSYTKQMPVAKPQVKASELKFSIDNILGLNKVSVTKPQEQQISPINTETMELPSKKRKGRGKNVESNSNKRLRTIFNQEQLDRLEVEFNRQQYMVGSERSYLATSLNLSESQVKIWFQNRRIKWRKSMGKNGSANANNSAVNDFDDVQSEQSYSDSDCDE